MLYMRNIRVAAVQFQHAAGDKLANLAAIERFVGDAAAQQVEIIVFPECCISGYWHLRKLSREQMMEIAEPVPGGQAAQRLLALSRQHGMTIGAGLVELGDDGKLFNSYVVAMPDGRWACHRKLHVFVSEYLSPGDRYTVFDTPHGCSVGVLICYDNSIVEDVRITALAGAEILLDPHQNGGCRSGSPCAMGPTDLEAGLRERSTGVRWIKARRPELYQPLTVRSGREMDTRAVRFEYDAS